MTDTDPLKAAHCALAAANAAKAEGQRLEAIQQQRIAVEQQKFAALKQAHMRLDRDVANAEAGIVMAEEEKLAAMNIELASEIVRRQATDPVRHIDWIVKNAALLRSRLRTDADASGAMNPLIHQAIALLPARSQLDTPLYLLGAPGKGQSWPERRRRLLAAAEAVPA